MSSTLTVPFLAPYFPFSRFFLFPVYDNSVRFMDNLYHLFPSAAAQYQAEFFVDAPFRNLLYFASADSSKFTLETFLHFLTGLGDVLEFSVAEVRSFPSPFLLLLFFFLHFKKIYCQQLATAVSSDQLRLHLFLVFSAWFGFPFFCNLLGCAFDSNPFGFFVAYSSVDDARSGKRDAFFLFPFLNLGPASLFSSSEAEIPFIQFPGIYKEMRWFLERVPATELDGRDNLRSVFFRALQFVFFTLPLLPAGKDQITFSLVSESLETAKNGFFISQRALCVDVKEWLAVERASKESLLFFQNVDRSSSFFDSPLFPTLLYNTDISIQNCVVARRVLTRLVEFSSNSVGVEFTKFSLFPYVTHSKDIGFLFFRWF